MGGEINYQYFDKNYRHTYLTKHTQNNVPGRNEPDSRLQKQDPILNKRVVHSDLDILRRLKR